MRKSVYTVLILIMLLFNATAISFADSPINIIIDGVTQNFEQSPIIFTGRTLVPMRAIFEALQCEVIWDSEKQLAYAYSPDKLTAMTLEPGYHIVSIFNGVKNGSVIDYTFREETTMDIEVKLIDNRIYVPVRFISEALGAKVDWDDNTKSVVISTSKQPQNSTTTPVVEYPSDKPVDKNGKEIHISDIVSFGGFSGMVQDIKGSKILVYWYSKDYWITDEQASYWAMLAGVNFESSQWFDSNSVTIQSSGY